MTTQVKQTYFEDVNEGMELPSKTKGPLTVTDLVRFAGASGDYAKIHHDREHTKTIAGLPDIILHGQGKLAFMVHVVTDWIGVQGCVKKIGGQYRGMDYVGAAVTSSGKVVRKYTEGQEHLVDLEMWNVNQQSGDTTAVGTATVSLPTRPK